MTFHILVLTNSAGGYEWPPALTTKATLANQIKHYEVMGQDTWGQVEHPKDAPWDNVSIRHYTAPVLSHHLQDGCLSDV